MKVTGNYFNGHYYYVLVPDSKIEFKSLVNLCKNNLGRGKIGGNWFIKGVYANTDAINSNLRTNSIYIKDKTHVFLIQMMAN